MKFRISLAIALCALVASALPALASSPQPARGTAVRTFVTLTEPPRPADGNVILHTAERGLLSGTVNGLFSDQLTGVLHSDGAADLHGFGTITGSVDGCRGGAVGTIPYAVTVKVTGAGVEVNFVSTDQSDNTLGVHLELDIVAGGPVATYSGTYFCSP